MVRLVEIPPSAKEEGINLTAMASKKKNIKSARSFFIGAYYIIL